jgi:hypothetical protein
MKVGYDGKRQAPASQSREMIRDMWFRVPEGERADRPVEFAKVVADFHNRKALAWLLCFTSKDQVDCITTFVVKRRLAGPPVTLLDNGFDPARASKACAEAVGGLGVHLGRSLAAMKAV